MVASLRRQIGNLKPSLRVLVLVTACSAGLHGQQPCVSAERFAAITSELRSGAKRQPDDALRQEIINMRIAVAASRIQRMSVADFVTEVPMSPDKSFEVTAEKAPERICAILNSTGWPGKSVVGPDGSAVWIGLIRKVLPLAAQRQLIPAISAGVDRGEIDKGGELAALIDRLRIAAGQPQLFGTQSAARDGFLVLFPLVSDQRVDAWRKDYNLGPLADYIRSLQSTYRMVVIRSGAGPRQVDPVREPDANGRQPEPELLSPNGEDDVLKVESSLVSIDATVAGAANLPNLTKDDFRVYEDGRPQQITSFKAAEAPFDIVLLLDLSGSTADELGLIKKTTRRFVEVKRPADRVAIVTFSDKQTIVSPLEADGAKLLERVGEIKDSGSSRVWDSMQFALDMLARESPAGHRKAIVAMTDGVDNALLYQPELGSKMLFADLLESVRRASVSFVPIYLDTEGTDALSQKGYADARRTLALLADESGGNYYAAKKLGDLRQVYEKVMGDLGRVYSLGYEPANDRRDGSWRAIKVELPTHPELKVRARSGYYAK